MPHWFEFYGFRFFDNATRWGDVGEKAKILNRGPMHAYETCHVAVSKTQGETKQHETTTKTK
jgi:hypothetical protein